MFKIRVWDLPTRLFHWMLAVLVTASIVTIKVGGTWVQWHFRCGYAILTLLFFRIVWALVGTRYARFSQFVTRPSRVLRYVRVLVQSDAVQSPGHNPLGALSVLAMLCSLLFQASSGLFANDDIDNQGPLAALVSKTTSDWLSELHSANAVVIYILLGLHVTAIGFYLAYKRWNLVGPMVTGWLRIAAPTPAQTQAWISIQENWKTWLRALAVVTVCAGLVWLIVSLTPPPVGG